MTCTPFNLREHKYLIVKQKCHVHLVRRVETNLYRKAVALMLNDNSLESLNPRNHKAQLSQRNQKNLVSVVAVDLADISLYQSQRVRRNGI